MKTFALVMIMALSSTSFAGEKLYSCRAQGSGEIVMTKTKDDHSVSFYFQRSKRPVTSTTDLFAADDNYTLISDSVDSDGTFLIENLCAENNPQFITILNVNEHLQKRFCLSCLEMQTGPGIK